MIEAQFERYKARLNDLLEEHLPHTEQIPRRLHEAMRYTTLAQGKRIRPCLVYFVGEQLGANLEQLDQAAAAVECIHSFSLVHDDLPCMDDDNLRRGRPSCHVAFDEATALLVGDALQTLAFSILSLPSSALSAEQQLALINVLTHASSSLGMAGGQALDMDATDQIISLEALQRIHELKTMALLKASAQMGMICADCQEPKMLEAILGFAEHLGLAFQIHDDILDSTASTKQLGKPQGSDERQGKNTYVSLLGVQQADQWVKTLYDKAITAVQPLPEQAPHFKALADYLLARES